MPISFITFALLIVSLFTNLSVEGFKKILNGTKIKYSSNVLAVILAVIISLVVCVGYIIFAEINVDSRVIFEIVAIMYLSFLIATVGYDKVIQTIMQLHVKKEDNNE